MFNVWVCLPLQRKKKYYKMYVDRNETPPVRNANGAACSIDGGKCRENLFYLSFSYYGLTSAAGLPI